MEATSNLQTVQKVITISPIFISNFNQPNLFTLLSNLHLLLQPTFHISIYNVSR